MGSVTVIVTHKFTHRNYPGTASNPVQAYHPNGRQGRRKADLDVLAFCVLEETARTTADDLDEDGAERPRLPRAVMDRRSRPGHSGGCWQPVAISTRSGVSRRRIRSVV